MEPSIKRPSSPSARQLSNQVQASPQNGSENEEMNGAKAPSNFWQTDRSGELVLDTGRRKNNVERESENGPRKRRSNDVPDRSRPVVVTHGGRREKKESQ